MSRGTRVRERLRRLNPSTWLSVVVGLGAVAALIVLIHPNLLGRALTHFDLALIPAIVVTSLAYYVLQGVRWQFLLRDAAVRLPMMGTVLLNLAGQATTLLPLGELTRAVLVTQAAEAEFGDVLATITVQELIYTLLLIVLAVPGLFEFHLSPAIPFAALSAACLALGVLTIPPLFNQIHGLVTRIPGLERFAGPLGQLQQETVELLHRPDTAGWSLISLAQAAAMVTAFWLVVTALAPAALSWPEAASIYALSSIAGAVSLIPGGIGASEAALAGLLIGAGLAPATATGVALMQRLADKGIATVSGFVAYGVARPRYHLSGLFSLRPRRERTGGAVGGGLAAGPAPQS
ncbi:MAG TPA: lysylphosphatidylglycerol synthase transmembrane domain-containing protein [Candidatus Micrarchaeia archaeon]|nr:lysylphosphatidylglycerol synthase transmembrane domain-containing protein [Candidatus Micrarchaeia archaeon]